MMSDAFWIIAGVWVLLIIGACLAILYYRPSHRPAPVATKSDGTGRVPYFQTVHLSPKPAPPVPRDILESLGEIGVYGSGTYSRLVARHWDGLHSKTMFRILDHHLGHTEHAPTLALWSMAGFTELATDKSAWVTPHVHLCDLLIQTSMSQEYEGKWPRWACE